MGSFRKRRRQNIGARKSSYREPTEEEELGNRIIRYFRSRNNIEVAVGDRPEPDIAIFKIVLEFGNVSA
jgi:hypothetical protein